MKQDEGGGEDTDSNESPALAPSQQEIRQHQQSSTLLPSPIASAVSLLTRSSSMYLRLGTYIGGLALDGARATTLTSLELSRAVIEGILTRAGRDVALRSGGELGRAEAESILERSLATLHSTISHISFVASTGFQITSTSISSAVDISQHLLATLDSILGSTDSSRAIASIITLIRREFENPATGTPGEKVGVVDLLIGVCGLTLLQRWCKRLTDQEVRQRNVEVLIWDVVVLDDGRRADIVGSTSLHDEGPGKLIKEGSGTQQGHLSTFMTAGGNDEILQSIQRQDTLADSGDEWPEAGLKERILKSLPPDASVSVTTETTTTKTITVEITGAQPPDLTPPPGVEIIEENPNRTSPGDPRDNAISKEDQTALTIPRYRVVYRTIRNKLRGTSIAAGGPTEVEDGQDQQMLDVPNRNVVELDTSSRESLDAKPGTGPVSNATISTSPISSPEPDEPMDMAGRVSEYFDNLRNNGAISSAGRNLSLPSSLLNAEANQKRPRKPMSPSSSISGSDNPPPRKLSAGKTTLPKKTKTDPAAKKPAEKKGIRNTLRKGSQAAISNLWNKENAPEVQVLAETRNNQSRPPWGANKPSVPRQIKTQASPNVAIPQRASSIIPAREAPRAPQRGNPNYFSSRDLGASIAQDVNRSPSRASYYSIHERRRDSLVSQTDTFSIHSGDGRPSSPTAIRSHLRAQASLVRPRPNEKHTSNLLPSPRKHRRSASYNPSIYTLKTNASEVSLIIAPRAPKSAFEDEESLKTLMRTGHIDGHFPHHHLVRNITRFIKFASASYGSSFMRVMGITTASGAPAPGIDSEHHYEHHSFSHHTQLPPSTILLSSFVDPQGGTDSTGKTNTGVSMVHYISLDHESRAVVLSCRGTLGFEDVLADMTCDYDDIVVRGKTYKVHQGIHASALRLLDGNASRVLATLSAALEEFPDYGLVMCGHSLGGAVCAVLAILVSEPNLDPLSAPESTFVTASSPSYHRAPLLLASSSAIPSHHPPQPITLPPGRPIHVYAYGPPATLSPSLRLATRGLITTVVNNADIVPHLSLGVLHDLQAVALAFKTDTTGAKHEVRARVWAGLTRGLAERWYHGETPSSPTGAGAPDLGSATYNTDTTTGSTSIPPSPEKDDRWALAALKALRANMLSPKLVPPGEVFIVETMRVLQRDARHHDDGASSSSGLGKPATRAVLKYIRDVERRFGGEELRLGNIRLLDHSPGRYEGSLTVLGRGVLGEY